MNCLIAFLVDKDKIEDRSLHDSFLDDKHEQIADNGQASMYIIRSFTKFLIRETQFLISTYFISIGDNPQMTSAFEREMQEISQGMNKLHEDLKKFQSIVSGLFTCENPETAYTYFGEVVNETLHMMEEYFPRKSCPKPILVSSNCFRNLGIVLPTRVK